MESNLIVKFRSVLCGYINSVGQYFGDDYSNI